QLRETRGAFRALRFRRHRPGLARQPRECLWRAGPGLHLQHSHRNRRLLSGKRSSETQRRRSLPAPFQRRTNRSEPERESSRAADRRHLFLLVAAPDENVLVVRRSLFDELGSFHGLNFEPGKYLRALLSRGNNFFLPRAQAENDPTHKQIIPYALIAHGDTVLHYVRGKKAGEQRLVAKGSIGIGGHMNQEDESLFNFAIDEAAYRAGVEREVNEEIKIETPFEDRIVALLNDDTTEVGRVHLGIVHVFRLAEEKVQKREAMITNVAFLKREELLARRENLESWSQFCVDSFDRLLR